MRALHVAEIHIGLRVGTSTLGSAQESRPNLALRLFEATLSRESDLIKADLGAWMYAYFLDYSLKMYSSSLKLPSLQYFYVPIHNSVLL
jgi:hypothetical protein